jgi:hypothetical protein
MTGPSVPDHNSDLDQIPFSVNTHQHEEFIDSAL